MTIVKVGAAPLLARSFGYLDDSVSPPEWVEGPVIDAYKLANPSASGDEFHVTSSLPSGMLRNQIVNGLQASPSTYPYTLFLSADMQFPEAIAEDYGPDGTGQTSYAAVFSQGRLIHVSGAVTPPASIDLTNIDPAVFAANYTTVGVCEPSMGPYGVAGEQALEEFYGIDTAAAYAAGKLKYFSPIEAVNEAVDLGGGVTGGVQSGFIPSALHYSGTGVLALPSGWTYRGFIGEDYDLHDQGALVIYDPGDTDASDAAQALLDWLATPAGQAALALWGLSF
ncbi:substrate-binding domain-containing protein [Pseudomonas lopnurensis]|uniref:substrate-binding domain-containing protein n=1 Tax=Pseudomonas lopnurensis TaxID=1477517 RepID=UPI00187A2A13|nr:substrate-binding domain-containing protein [Pseudomonas lopnurensis]MBE7376540.1 substrate-binding domain-containing protein [Pseudomonas lopnurensis]